MNISIVTAVYNEEKNIKNLLNSIKKLDFISDSFLEICIVNDGSKDNTDKAIKDWQRENRNINVVYQSMTNNVGRRKAREIGARLASFENILITDARCELFPDVLKQLEKINYEPVNGNAIHRDSGFLSRFFNILRLKLFSNSFGESFEDVFIDEKNFDSISKGTTLFFINRERFLRNQTKECGKYVNEDTSILFSIVKEKKILKTSRIKCFYNQRENILEEIKHLFNRGPRFIFHYYNIKKIHFYLINVSILLFLLAIFLIIFGFLKEIFLLFLFIDFIFSIYFSGSLKDFILLFVFLPILFFSFFAGIVKGIFIKFFRNF